MGRRKQRTDRMRGAHLLLATLAMACPVVARPVPHLGARVAAQGMLVAALAWAALVDAAAAVLLLAAAIIANGIAVLRHLHASAET